MQLKTANLESEDIYMVDVSNNKYKMELKI